MKSRTSFSKLTTFRKDLIRFAPVWALYLIGIMLILFEAGFYDEYDSFAQDFVAELPMAFGIINMIYAGVCAVMIFGDLYNARMCYSLHALPQRRESWLLSHLASGFLFSLIPNLLAAGYLMTQLRDYWYLALYWLLSAQLQFIFFYGLATLSAMLTGNRFAMLTVYAGLNFISMLAYATVEVLYLPMLTGVTVDGDTFARFCPAYFMMEHFEYFRFAGVRLYGGEWNDYRIFQEYRGLGTGWGYLTLTAVIGLVLMGVSFLLYRLRHLECAGDFVAFRKLKAIACLIMTLCVALCFALMGDVLSGGYLLWLIVGVIVGYFGSLMLLERRLKVFRPKVFIWFAVLCAVLAASFLAVGFDVFGIESWLPEASDVRSVTVANGDYEYYNGGNRMSVTLTEEAQIAEIIEAHEDILDSLDDSRYSGYRHNVTLTYKLDNGRTVKRSYYARVEGENYAIIQKYLYTPENILGYTDWEKYVKSVRYMYADKGEVPAGLYEELLEALKTDCEAGYVGINAYEDVECYIDLETENPYGAYTHRTLDVMKGAKNTLAILESPEMILGYTDWEEYVDGISYILLDGTELRPADYRGLLEAMRKDCENGDLDVFGETKLLHTVTIEVNLPGGVYLYRDLSVTPDSEHTMDWITEFYGPAGG